MLVDVDGDVRGVCLLFSMLTILCTRLICGFVGALLEFLITEERVAEGEIIFCSLYSFLASAIEHFFWVWIFKISFACLYFGQWGEDDGCGDKQLAHMGQEGEGADCK